MSDRGAVKRKVRSLLAVAAPRSGATDAERETARRLAEKLMQEHGLAASEIPEREVERPQPARHAPPPPPMRQYVVIVNLGGFGSTNATTNGAGFWTFM